MELGPPRALIPPRPPTKPPRPRSAGEGEGWRSSGLPPLPYVPVQVGVPMGTLAAASPARLSSRAAAAATLRASWAMIAGSAVILLAEEPETMASCSRAEWTPDLEKMEERRRESLLLAGPCAAAP